MNNVNPFMPSLPAQKIELSGDLAAEFNNLVVWLGSRFEINVVQHNCDASLSLVRFSCSG